METIDSSTKRLAVEMFIRTTRLHRYSCENAIQKNVGCIHHSQNRILMFLSHNKTQKSQTEIAKAFNISPAAVTVSLKKLESDGYIEKITGKDNRYNEISITKKGEEIVKKTCSTFALVDEATFKSFSDEEFRSLITCLEKIENNLMQFGKDESN